MKLKEMVIALLNESDLHLSDDVVEAIVDRVEEFGTLTVSPFPYFRASG